MSESQQQTDNSQPEQQQQLTAEELQQIEFQKKLAKAMYKTTNKQIGTKTTSIPQQPRKGINGKFTDHLIYSGMYKNASLNTTADADRWVKGSRDWMEHLG